MWTLTACFSSNSNFKYQYIKMFLLSRAKKFSNKKIWSYTVHSWVKKNSSIFFHTNTRFYREHMYKHIKIFFPNLLKETSLSCWKELKKILFFTNIHVLISSLYHIFIFDDIASACYNAFFSHKILNWKKKIILFNDWCELKYLMKCKISVWKNWPYNIDHFR